MVNYLAIFGVGGILLGTLIWLAVKYGKKSQQKTTMENDNNVVRRQRDNDVFDLPGADRVFDSIRKRK